MGEDGIGLTLTTLGGVENTLDGGDTLPAAEESAPGNLRPPGTPAQGMLIGRYLVISKLGAGAMGVVFAAFDPQLDRKVALKLLKHTGNGVGTARSRLQREAQSLAKLGHPNVVSVFDVGVHSGQLFVAMEFVAGQTLGEWMAAVDAPRPWQEILDVFMAAGRGLAAAHETGLIHRDFKPDNVMLGDDGRVRVMDFGLARADSPSEEPLEGLAPMRARVGKLTATGAMMGTPAYMSLEQFRGSGVDARTDQFSFCVALYEALYGERPFAAQTLGELLAALEHEQVKPAPASTRVPMWLRQVVLRGLAVDPDARFASMTEVLDALADDPLAKRRRFAMWAGLVVVLVAASFSLATLWTQVSEQKRLVAEQSAAREQLVEELREQSKQLRQQKNEAVTARSRAERAQAQALGAKSEAEVSQKETERSVRQMFEVALRPLTEHLIEERAKVGVVEVDERWTTLLGRDGRAVVAATLAGGSRAVVGDVSMFDAPKARAGRDSLLLEITSQWLLADQGQRRVAILTETGKLDDRLARLRHDLVALGYECDVASATLEPSSLTEVGMLIVADHQTRGFEADELATIDAFAKRGGGILALGRGPSWLARGGPQDLDDYPMNIALAALGARWSDASVDASDLEHSEEVVILFENTLDSAVNLYALNAGHEEFYTTLEPHDSRLLLTTRGRRWVFRHAADGRSLGTESSEDDGQVVTIGASITRRRGKPKPKPAAAPAPASAERSPVLGPRAALTPGDLEAGLADAQKIAKVCGKKLQTLQPEAIVNVEIDGSGRVVSTRFRNPVKGTKEATCIGAQLDRLSFPETRGGGRAEWTLKLY